MINERWLDTLFQGKAKWSVQREAYGHTTLSFQCTRLTPVLRINENLFEDTREPGLFVARQCIDLYARHHSVCL